VRGAIFITLLACSACAHVQPTQSWPELRQRLAPGRPIAVVDVKGSEVQGKVASVSASALTLKVNGALRRFDSADVREVRRNGDSLRNGLLIGAAVGVLGAILPDDRCSGSPRVCNDRQILPRLTFAAAATAVGIGVDALHRDRTVLYLVAPSPVVRE
jgi:hypothetical protein